MAFKTYSITKKYIDPRKEPFYIEDVSGEDNVVTITNKGENNAPTAKVYISTDNVSYTYLGENTRFSDLTFTVSANSKTYVKAVPYLFGSISDVYSRYINGDWYMTQFKPSKNFNIGGNIMSLIYGLDFTGNETTWRHVSNNYHFAYFFGRYNSSNQFLISAQNLILPALTVNSSYNGMFETCNNLKYGPRELPNFEGAGCSTMFAWSGLEVAPIIKKETMEGFYRCFTNTKITSLTCLATSTVQNATQEWVSGLPSGGTFIKNPNATFWTTGGNGIPYNWTVQNYQG